VFGGFIKSPVEVYQLLINVLFQLKSRGLYFIKQKTYLAIERQIFIDGFLGRMKKIAIQ